MPVNNETLGQSAEKVICDLSGLDSSHLETRSNPEYEKILMPLISKALKQIPKVVTHTGLERGSRGGQSKSKVDFILAQNETLSLKTNKSANTMVCAPEVGQASWVVLEKYYSSLLKENNIPYLDKKYYKKLVFNSIAQFTEVQINLLFSCDYLLWIFLLKGFPWPGAPNGFVSTVLGTLEDPCFFLKLVNSSLTFPFGIPFAFISGLLSK